MLPEQQWREICEWAGWRVEGKQFWELPPQDMNSLFRWIVPKYLDYFGDYQADAMFSRWTWALIYSYTDPFDGLANEIYLTLKGD